MSSDFISIIKSRGFVHQFTDEEGLKALLKTPGQRAYIGFDCTAPSLHVGSLLQIMLLRWWQKCGHEPIVLLGGGTTKIGDPSGKDEARQLLTDADIEKNMRGIEGVFRKFLSFSNNESPTPSNAALLVNNAEWLDKLNYVTFLRDYGRHFSINRMLTMDSVRLRLERDQHLSFLEFNYMILQSYDFIELNNRYGCQVQMGGSDQWGNIIMGVELQRRLLPPIASSTKDLKSDLKTSIDYLAKHRDRLLYGITSPLITTASGAKMGKTAAGAIWLNEDLLSPYDYWQFWRNTEDGDVIRFLKLFTELPLDTIAQCESWLGSAKINDAKILLATEATTLLHGREAAERAAITASETFAGSGISDTLPEVVIASLDLPIYEVLVAAGFAESNSKARALIKGNGVRVNDVPVTEETAKLASLANPGSAIKLSSGKKKHALVKVK